MTCDLNSAEGTTRFLRSKTEPASKIVEVASGLLDNSSQIYLPNLKLFIFDLICDRLHDNSSKGFKEWKFIPEVWQLFNKTWNVLAEDPNDIQRRNNHFKKFKLIEILCIIFKESKSVHLLNSLFDSIELITKDYYISIEENSSLDLLTAYLHCIGQIDRDHPQVNQWTRVILHIYELPNLRAQHRFNKKTTTKFYTESLSPILNYITSAKGTTTSSTAEALEVLLSEVLSNKESHSFLNQNVKTFLKENESKTDNKSILFFFSLLIKTLSKNMTLCEEIYTTIIGVPKFSALSESLLEILSKSNRTLSTSFLQNIYEKEFKSSNKRINWELIGHLIELDVDLAVENATDIVNKVSNAHYLSIGEKITRAFVRAREFIRFIDEVWVNAISSTNGAASQGNHKWTSDAFIDIVSKSVDELTVVQFTSLVGKLTESKKHVTPRLVAIVKGLLNSKSQKIISVKSTILENEGLVQYIEDSWEIRYYLLCLYGNEYEVRKEDLVVPTNRIPSCYYFYTLFRMNELSIEISEKLLPTVIPKYILYLEQESKAKNGQLSLFLSTFLQRWLVLANTHFNKDQLRKVISLILLSWDTSRIIQYFDVYGYLFFEQKQIVEVLIDTIEEELSNSSKVNSINSLSLILKIPIQCFHKNMKVKLIDSIYEKSFSSRQPSVEAIESLTHLLKVPSFKSTIETNLDNLISLLSSEGDTNKSSLSSSSICEQIWMNNVSSFKDPKCKEFILNAFERLSKYFQALKLKSQKSLSNEYKFSFILISATYANGIDEDIVNARNDLAQIFAGVSTKFLDIFFKAKDFENVNWVLNSLIASNTLDASFLAKIKSIGASISNSDHKPEENEVINTLRCNLFKSTSILLESNLSSISYLTCLYIALKDEYEIREESSLLDHLKKHLTSLTDSDLLQAHNLVLFSLEAESGESNVQVLTQILLCYLNKSILTKNREKDTCIKILISSLSILIDKYDLIARPSTQVEVLKCLKRCLSELGWCFNQYALETTLTLITRVSQEDSFVSDETRYILLTQVVSHILLYHRYRLTSRHHLIMSICISLLEPLSLKGKLRTSPVSVDSASSYARLLGNLCEPSETTKTSSANKSLNSSSALIKRTLRKHLPVLLINFIYLSLKFNFPSATMDTILSGIYKIFDVLTQIELQLVSSTLDIPGRTYYKSLYSSYKDNGKWRDE